MQLKYLTLSGTQQKQTNVDITFLLSKLNLFKVPPSAHHPIHSLMMSYRTPFIPPLQKVAPQNSLWPNPATILHSYIHPSSQTGSLSDLEKIILSSVSLLPEKPPCYHVEFYAVPWIYSNIALPHEAFSDSFRIKLTLQ